MKKPNNWSIAGAVAGGIYAVVTIVQYWLMYPDTDKFISNITIAGLMIAVSWLYNEHLTKKNEIQAMGEFLKDLSDERWQMN